MNNVHEVLSTITEAAVLVTVLLISMLSAKMYRGYRECWVWWYILPPVLADWWIKQSHVWIAPGAVRAEIDIASASLVTLDDLDQLGSNAPWPTIRAGEEVTTMGKHRQG